MLSLAAFQQAFGDALRGDGAAVAPWLDRAPAETPGLSVYQNTVTRGSIDVLVSIFSTVARLVGEDWFRAAAAVYVAEHPPRTPSMLRYGAEFADWLAGFPPAQDTPYLATVARLDRLWWDAYFAADAEALEASALSRLDAGALERTTITLHPSVRLAAFDQTLASLWLAQRDGGAGGAFEIAEAPECLLIVRRGLQVEATIISPAAHAFLAACAVGESLMSAAGRALAADPNASLPELIAAQLATGAFSALVPTDPGP